MTLDLGLDEKFTYEGSEEAARIPPVTPKTYEFSVDRIDLGNTLEGRPRWLVWLRIVNAPEYVNRTLPYNAVLPWIDPAKGQWADPKEHFALTTLCQGTGVRWMGDLRQEDVQATLRGALKGATGFMRVGLRTYTDPNSGEKATGNTVKIVVSKRER